MPRTQGSRDRSRTLYPLLAALCLMLCALFSGCYSETEVVNIKVKVDSKVNISKYRTIAVVDFFDDSGKSSGNHGKILARMIRKQLKNAKEFRVLDEKEMVLENEINADDIEDPIALMSISSQLGVDALIVGKFSFRQVYQPVPYITRNYFSATREYNMETRTYIQRVYRLSFHAKLVDGATGETIFSYSPPVEEKPEYRSGWGISFSGGADPESLRAMAMKPVTNFVMSLVPHYETERRILVK